MSSLGPTIIFDKSVLESLNVDESVWLDAFYHTIITPLFYVETLADLNKKHPSRTSSKIVSHIANKVPEMGCSPNANHRDLSIGDLLGYKVDISRRPILVGGKTFSVNNKLGIIFDETPEAKAFRRWQKHQFYEIEKEVACLWRESLAKFDYDYFLDSIEEIQSSNFRKPKSIEDAFEIATLIIKGEGHRYKTLQLLRDLLNIDDINFKKIVKAWNKQGMPPLIEFAPYSAYVLKIDIFFLLSTSSGLISKERKSNRADMAYIYYLPFTNIFTSSDKLHRKVIHLFLDSDQRFIFGPDLKKDLSELDKYFDETKTPEEKENGVFSFSWYPPDNNRFLTTRMWDDIRPHWRLNNNVKIKTEQKQKVPDDLKKHIKKAYADIKSKSKYKPLRNIDIEDANDIIIKRSVRARKGKWKLLSDEVINSNERLSEDDVDQ